jgi:hypothetical protein
MATYFRDFTDGIADWTADRWQTAATWSVSGDELSESGNTQEGISWDDIDADADRDDFEIYSEISQSAWLSSTGHRQYFGRAVDGPTAYVCRMRNNGLQIGKVVGGTNTTIGTGTAFTPVADTWYAVRMRVVGTSIKARQWLAGDTEPSTWEIDTTDSEVTAAGWVGILAGAVTSTIQKWRKFGVGTNGDTAPTSAGGGSFNASLEDSASAADALAPQLTVSAAVADSAASADTFTAAQNAFSATVADLAALGDTLGASLIANAALAGAGALSEVLTPQLTANRALADAATAADAFAPQLTANGAVADAVAAADALGSSGYQPGRPYTDVSVGAWTASAGTDFAALLKDEDAGTYIRCTATESSYVGEIQRPDGSDLDDPSVDAGYELRITLADGFTPSGSLEVEVLVNGTQIATRTIASPVAGQEYVWTLTEGEAAAISNHSQLQHRFTVH